MQINDIDTCGVPHEESSIGPGYHCHSVGVFAVFPEQIGWFQSAGYISRGQGVMDDTV